MKLCTRPASGSSLQSASSQPPGVTAVTVTYLCHSCDGYLCVSQLSRWPIYVTEVMVTYLYPAVTVTYLCRSCDGDLSVSAVMTTYLCHSCHGDLSVMLSYVVACDTCHLPMDRRSVCSLFTVCNDLPARFKSIDTLITTAKVLINYNKGNLLWINKLWLNNIKQSFLRKGPFTSATYHRCTRTKTFSYF